MNNSTQYFTSSTNSTNDSIGLVKRLDIFLYSINFLFGLPAHSYIIWLIITGPRNGVASEFFILNLSVCEIGNSLNTLFCILVIFIQCSHLTTLIGFLRGLLVTGHPLFHCLICVERYLAVVHPVTFLKYKPLRYRVICCAVAWIIILGSCLCCMFTVDHSYFYAWFFSLQYLLYFSVQLFCLVAVLRALKQSGPGERARHKEDENHMKRRAFHIILITTVTMVIIYVPFTILEFSIIVTQHYIKELFSFALACNILACFVQPIHYLKQAGKFSWLESLTNRCMIY